MSPFRIINLPTFRDDRGILTVLEGQISFTIERIYWIYGADTKLRGGHRHHRTYQALIAISGAVEIYMNDGIHIENVNLDSPSKCLLVEPKDWHTMSFGEKSILLVLSSEKYDPSDYIDSPY